MKLIYCTVICTILHTSCNTRNLYESYTSERFDIILYNQSGLLIEKDTTGNKILKSAFFAFGREVGSDTNFARNYVIPENLIFVQDCRSKRSIPRYKPETNTRIFFIQTQELDLHPDWLKVVINSDTLRIKKTYNSPIQKFGQEVSYSFNDTIKQIEFKLIFPKKNIESNTLLLNSDFSHYYISFNTPFNNLIDENYTFDYELGYFIPKKGSIMYHDLENNPYILNKISNKKISKKYRKYIKMLKKENTFRRYRSNTIIDYGF